MVITMLPLCPKQHHNSHVQLSSARKALQGTMMLANSQTKSYVSLSISICCTLHV